MEALPPPLGTTCQFQAVIAPDASVVKQPALRLAPELMVCCPSEKLHDTRDEDTFDGEPDEPQEPLARFLANGALRTTVPFTELVVLYAPVTMVKFRPVYV